MDDAYASDLGLLLPQVTVLLVLFGVVFALGAFCFLLNRGAARASSFTPILPHPSQPMSMLVFVALPVFLDLVSLAWRFTPAFPVAPINSPESFHRYSRAPVNLEPVEWDGPPRFTYPEQTADFTARAARWTRSPSAETRLKAVRDLAWWTGVCPNSSGFTIPILLGMLEDPDLKIRAAAAGGLGSLGGN